MATKIPKTLRYSAEHEWVRLDGDLVVVGITDYAQHEMREVVYVELPKLGKSIEKMEILCVIETMKAASDVFSPVSGEVVEVNEALKEKPELVNSSPYAHGWIAKLKPTGKREEELKELLDADAYRGLIEAQKK